MLPLGDVLKARMGSELLRAVDYRGVLLAPRSFVYLVVVSVVMMFIVLVMNRSSATSTWASLRGVRDVSDLIWVRVPDVRCWLSVSTV